MQIYLPDLVTRLRTNQPLTENDLLVEATIDKPKCDKYHDPKEHLKLFANTYIIESSIKDLYELSFNDPLRHCYLYEGRGLNKCDCLTEFHDRIEIKWFKHHLSFNDWINGRGFDANHDAHIALCYCSDINKVYVVNLLNMTYRDAIKQFEKPLDLIK